GFGRRPTMTGELVRASMPVTFTADKDNPGRFRALVSAYNVRYRIGFSTYHTIEAGAFADSVADQDLVPIFWQHNWDWSEQPPIGEGAPAEDDDEGGLVIAGRFYVDLSADAAAVYEANKSGALREWSIGYRVLETRRDTDDDLHHFVTKAELW